MKVTRCLVKTKQEDKPSWAGLHPYFHPVLTLTTLWHTLQVAALTRCTYVHDMYTRMRPRKAAVDSFHSCMPAPPLADFNDIFDFLLRRISYSLPGYRGSSFLPKPLGKTKHFSVSSFTFCTSEEKVASKQKGRKKSLRERK